MTLQRTLIASLAAGALLFTACGGDDDTASSDTSTTAAEAAPDSSAAPDSGGSAAETDAVAIVDFKYAPEDATVAAGAEITFTNEDATPHTATARNGEFDTGNIDGGDATGTLTAPSEPGTYEYYCSFHPFMVGNIVVQ